MRVNGGKDFGMLDVNDVWKKRRQNYSTLPSPVALQSVSKNVKLGTIKE
jgi:hypothetical protein